MFYSTAQRENVKNSNPGVSFGKRILSKSILVSVLTNTDTGEIGKILGAQWRGMTAEQKVVSVRFGQCDSDLFLMLFAIALREESDRR